MTNTSVLLSFVSAAHTRLRGAAMLMISVYGGTGSVDVPSR